jgi:hypothetical protein
MYRLAASSVPPENPVHESGNGECFVHLVEHSLMAESVDNDSAQQQLPTVSSQMPQVFLTKISAAHSDSTATFIQWFTQSDAK